MSHHGKIFPGRNYSHVNILQSNLSSLHWFLKLPNPPRVYLALVHFSRRHSKDTLSSLFCRQRSCPDLNTVNLRQANSHKHKRAPQGFCPGLDICFLGREGRCGCR